MNTVWIPVAAAISFLAFSVYVTAGDGVRTQNSWLFPALASFAFLLFSIHAITAEGMLGFWTEHTRNLWGNQIWIDLLSAIGIAWFLVVPQAKALGMRTPLWLVLIVCTGSVGFLAMIARLLYLRDRSEVRA